MAVENAHVSLASHPSRHDVTVPLFLQCDQEPSVVPWPLLPSLRRLTIFAAVEEYCPFLRAQRGAPHLRSVEFHFPFAYPVPQFLQCFPDAVKEIASLPKVEEFKFVYFDINSMSDRRDHVPTFPHYQYDGLFPVIIDSFGDRLVSLDAFVADAPSGLDDTGVFLILAGLPNLRILRLHWIGLQYIGPMRATNFNRSELDVWTCPTFMSLYNIATKFPRLEELVLPHVDFCILPPAPLSPHHLSSLRLTWWRHERTLDPHCTPPREYPHCYRLLAVIRQLFPFVTLETISDHQSAFDMLQPHNAIMKRLESEWTDVVHCHQRHGALMSNGWSLCQLCTESEDEAEDMPVEPADEADDMEPDKEADE